MRPMDKPSPKPLHKATLAIHADQNVEETADIAPPLHTTTTFIADSGAFSYARNDQPTRRRLEQVLGALEGGHAVAYASGQAATYAVMRHFRPPRVAVDRGYHGTHAILARLQEEGVQVIAHDEELREGDLVWLETPKNPTCELEDIALHAGRARSAGAILAVDSTFATPVLQNPLALGAHVVMHSSTKFLAGHSDAMGGVLVVPEQEGAERLCAERTVSGAIPGAMECWLTLRSVRTLGIRVAQQSASAARLAQWLESRVARVWHPSLPSHPGYQIGRQQMSGPGAIMSIELDSMQAAKALPAKLRLFQDATSLGGVESLVEWRHKVDPLTVPTLLRLSIGLEDTEDLIADLEQGLAG